MMRCSRDSFFWSPKDPSPLAERTEELGGCELTRLLLCPVVLGFLKPAVRVQCASGQHFSLPLDMYGELSALREHLSEELSGENDASTLQLSDESQKPIEGQYLKGPCNILCARHGETLADAYQALKRAPSAQGSDPVDDGVAAAIREAGDNIRKFDA